MSVLFSFRCQDTIQAQTAFIRDMKYYLLDTLLWESREAISHNKVKDMSDLESLLQ